MHCWGENPVVTAKLQLNGQDRFSEREDTIDLVQPYQHHTRHPDTGINVYSFALRPEEHQPLEPVTSVESITQSSIGCFRCYRWCSNCQFVYMLPTTMSFCHGGMGGLASTKLFITFIFKLF